MRVLNINKFHYMRGGVERYYFALTKLLEDNGHDVIHFSMQDERNFKSKFSKHFVSNLELGNPGLKMLNHVMRPIWSKQSTEKLEELINIYKPDIAHIHLLYHHISPSILPLLKKKGIPVVMTLHDYKLICPNYLLFTKGNPCKRCKGHKYYNAVLHRCMKNSFAVSAYGAMEMSIHKAMQVYEKNVDAMIAPSKFVRDIFVEFGQDPGKISVIPHFIDPAFFEQTKSENEVKSDKKYMLFFGRLAVEKGLDKILEMMYIYKPGLQLKIAGSGSMEGYLKDYISSKGLEKKVEFLGHLDAKELVGYIKGAQLVLMPSRFYEPFGFAALETIALGTPLVASASGALSDIVEPEVGKLFKRDDLAEMAEAIQEVLTWDKKKVKEDAKKLINQKYLSQKHYASLMTVYDHLIM